MSDDTHNQRPDPSPRDGPQARQAAVTIAAMSLAVEAVGLRRSFGRLPAERLDPLLGFGVLVLWIVGLLGLAAVFFVRGDIRQ